MTSVRALKGFKEDVIRQQEGKTPNQSLWSGLNHAIIHHFHEFLFLCIGQQDTGEMRADNREVQTHLSPFQ